MKSSSEFSSGSSSGFSSGFSKDELEFLKAAAQFFDRPGLFIQGMDLLSTPLEIVQSRLPVLVREQLGRVSRSAIEHALILSIKTVSTETLNLELNQAQGKSKAVGRLHAGMASFVGGCGGFFGLPALPVELPMVTLIMLRSIAEIARQNGADINSPETKLDCLYILSLGGGVTRTETINSEYYASRLAFAEILSSATSFITASSAKDVVAALENRTAPVLLRLVAEIAAKFQIQMSRKLLAQITPVIGAVGGAGVNLMFANYYSTCARFHFGLKRLEQLHGTESTRKLFEKLRIEGHGKSTE